MAYPKRTYRKKPRATPRKRYARRATLGFVRRPLQASRLGPLGRTFKTTLNLYHTGVLDPDGLTPSAFRVFAGGLYDAISDSGVEQPRGFDQMMVLYNKYTVIGSKCTVTFSPSTSITTNAPYTIGIAIRDKASAGADDVRDYIESGNCVWKNTPLSSATDSSTSLSARYSTKKYHGLKNLMDNGAYGGTATTNPDKDASFLIFCSPGDRATNMPEIQVAIFMEYQVIFHDPKPFVKSS